MRPGKSVQNAHSEPAVDASAQRSDN
ncbi:hypothetical protein FMEAI12_5360017 [Parafrankia sp. Ea1.12]|nr:hypothetical protein FMEAI12_5360017 [Parafrankia sp. Ea1.12]